MQPVHSVNDQYRGISTPPTVKDKIYNDIISLKEDWVSLVDRISRDDFDVNNTNCDNSDGELFGEPHCMAPGTDWKKVIKNLQRLSISACLKLNIPASDCFDKTDLSGIPVEKLEFEYREAGAQGGVTSE
ncbi:hypothetical protein GE280_001138 [Escherichia coli]|uniref:hypothetical protein n=1 Tax=Escherichia coli TaxID=562 RepID=UPI00148280BC|nr:hypothetical protein [Escherichia coli]EGO7479178.1 hypothetical protein [Escherichia coli]EIX2297481.1 hypothetical protein [Escherichia coli]ELF4435689.1 hypothetical protein [Escherichia coli]NNQ14965.1 hypothetical protein [Escherichia coli]NNQ32155.1 hypothetical protein [Escherichia coli]